MLKTMPLPACLPPNIAHSPRSGAADLRRMHRGCGYNEIVEIIAPDGDVRIGQVLEVDKQRCMVRIFLGTSGLDLERTRIRFTGDVARLGVSLSMLGRVLNGSGQPIDGGPPIIPERSLDINGLPINPSMRTHPSEFIQTGVSAIDGLNTLTRGQKLPIFSGAGLPANELAAQIASHARVVGGNKTGSPRRRKRTVRSGLRRNRDHTRDILLHGSIPCQRRVDRTVLLSTARTTRPLTLLTHARRRRRNIWRLRIIVTCHPDGYDQLLRHCANRRASMKCQAGALSGLHVFGPGKFVRTFGTHPRNPAR